MKEGQKYIYYACGDSVSQIASLPQTELCRDKGYEMLYLTEDVDEFTIQSLMEFEEKQFKSVTADDAELQTEEEKKETEKKGTGQENDTAVQENPAVNRRGNVHVVLANGGEGDPVAEIVKEKLQEELDNYPLPSEEGSSIDMDIPSEEPAAEAAPGSYEARGKQTSGEAQLS